MVTRAVNGFGNNVNIFIEDRQRQGQGVVLDLSRVREIVRAVGALRNALVGQQNANNLPIIGPMNQSAPAA